MKYFYSSFIVTIIGLVISFFIGSWNAIYICILLSILEVSISFDNAVVNAKVLNKMNEKWQKRFIYYGIPIAVFGMRFVFPIAIVSIASGIGIYDTLLIAINDPKTYEENLNNNSFQIYTFGGAFLLMVFLDFFFDKERDIFWIKFLESNFLVRFLNKIPFFTIVIAVILGIIFIFLAKNYSGSDANFWIAYFSSILIYIAIKSSNSLFKQDVTKSGIMGFLYLEVLDASFSFDGVIGAFALSNNIFIIMIGLGIGAMFVRSLTIYFVKKKTLSNFIFLEHGAHYAIFTLAIIMMLKVFLHVSEIITGLIGISFIGISLIHSILKRHKQKTN